jgi:hypothetical protein
MLTMGFLFNLKPGAAWDGGWRVCGCLILCTNLLFGLPMHPKI